MILENVLATGSGSLVGFVLGLIGGGGSILAVPYWSMSWASNRPMSPSARVLSQSR